MYVWCMCMCVVCVCMCLNECVLMYVWCVCMFMCVCVFVCVRARTHLHLFWCPHRPKRKAGQNTKNLVPTNFMIMVLVTCHSLIESRIRSVGHVACMGRRKN